MTERVLGQEHSERTAQGESCLWKCFRKTIPELCVEGAGRL